MAICVLKKTINKGEEDVKNLVSRVRATPTDTCKMIDFVKNLLTLIKVAGAV